MTAGSASPGADVDDVDLPLDRDLRLDSAEVRASAAVLLADDLHFDSATLRRLTPWPAELTAAIAAAVVLDRVNWTHRPRPTVRRSSASPMRT